MPEPESWQGMHVLSYSHTVEDIDRLLAAYREVLPILKAAIAEKDIASRLRGRPVEPVFRKVR